MLLAFYTHLFFHQNSTYLEKVKDYSLLLSIKVIFKDYDIKYVGILFFTRMFDCGTLTVQILLVDTLDFVCFVSCFVLLYGRISFI